MPPRKRVPAPGMSRLPPEPDLLAALATADLEIEGRLRGASNATLRCTLDVAGEKVRCVYKPVAGERPLWDFAEGTLSNRELATAAVDRLLGWHLVPPTVWRTDGPAGPGMCQLWIEESEHGQAVVDVVRPDQVPEHWHVVLHAEDEGGRPVALVHADDAQLHAIAVLDALVNNADRKAGHILSDGNRLWAIDHGVTFNADDKLRTVLWGWAGHPIAEPLLSDLGRVEPDIAEALAPWLTAEEITITQARIATLAHEGSLPLPNERWPSIPWPVF